MARDANDLKALILAGDSYTETVSIDYMGEVFNIEIRPLTESELTEVNRQMKLSANVIRKIAEKVKANKALSAEEKATMDKEALDTILSDPEFDLGGMNFTNFVLAREFCKRGIVDKGLRDLVSKFRYGLTEMLSTRIQTISNVPPAVVANFFGQKKDS